MKKTLNLIAICFLFFSLYFTVFADEKKNSDISIEKWGLTFILPSDKWYPGPHQISPDGKREVLYYFKREPIINKDNLNVIPNISFIFEELPKDYSIITYSMNCRINAPFKIISMFAVDDKLINLSNFLGYIGEYTGKNGLDHKIIVVHAISNDKGMQVIMDVTLDLFDTVKPEFDYSLKTLTFN